MLCARPGCTDVVYPWLHPRYCSRSCAAIDNPPDRISLRQAEELAVMKAEADTAPRAASDLVGPRVDEEPARIEGPIILATKPVDTTREPVGFDEPAPRGWLTRAIAWVLR